VTRFVLGLTLNTVTGRLVVGCPCSHVTGAEVYVMWNPVEDGWYRVPEKQTTGT
jgi:hypothetical protein